jgi:IS1 family transposase
LNNFSSATFSLNYYQKKRQFNKALAKLLVAGVSQRDCGRILKLNKKTVVNKFIFIGRLAQIELLRENLKHPKAKIIQFDDMETFEHTKCKPVSISLVIQDKTRRILGYEPSQMPARGLLVYKALKKYGYRADLRPLGRQKLLSRVKHMVEPDCLIKSDENPHYPPLIKRNFPESEHRAYKGKRGAITGQGELKKVGFDPLFSLNHTCAKLREGINRLKRRTWSTTKKIEMLSLHLAIMAVHHNRSLSSA